MAATRRPSDALERIRTKSCHPQLQHDAGGSADETRAFRNGCIAAKRAARSESKNRPTCYRLDAKPAQRHDPTFSHLRRS